MANAVKKGSHEDVDYLITCIEKFNAGLSIHTSLSFLVAITEFDGDRRVRAGQWLETIGFKENSFGTLYLPSDEVHTVQFVNV